MIEAKISKDEVTVSIDGMMIELLSDLAVLDHVLYGNIYRENPEAAEAFLAGRVRTFTDEHMLQKITDLNDPALKATVTEHLLKKPYRRMS